ncbi:ABC transporter ATP-binding protein [Treponema primitia]|uniref:ABC transporter ATP-binding protein n=1 Tax=Treponema primitia TaxID=88058 RepID=UPI000255509D|nr:ATP-binding cassette domain-containing protein [Treponema primitia]
MRLEAKNLGFKYGGIHAEGPWIFRNINLTFDQEKRVALLGDSGIGKSTLGKLLACYEKPTEGAILLGDAVFGKGYYPVQLILQHPETAVNPRFKLRDTLNEGYTPGEALLDRLGIEPAWLDRYPQELSGGELQRFCIARTLGPQTRFIIADEISAMFDLITQAQIWEALLAEIEIHNIGLIAITHDRDLGKRICEDFIQMEDIIGIT